MTYLLYRRLWFFGLCGLVHDTPFCRLYGLQDGNADWLLWCLTSGFIILSLSKRNLQRAYGLSQHLNLEWRANTNKLRLLRRNWRSKQITEKGYREVQKRSGEYGCRICSSLVYVVFDMGWTDVFYMPRCKNSFKQHIS